MQQYCDWYLGTHPPPTPPPFGPPRLPIAMYYSPDLPPIPSQSKILVQAC